MIFPPLKSAAARAGKRAAWSISGALFAAVGLGFLSAALWLLLVTMVTPLYACVVLGLLYLGIGCISFAAAATAGKSRDGYPHLAPEHNHTPAKTGVTAPPLVEAFLYGLQAGSEASKNHKPH